MKFISWNCQGAFRKKIEIINAQKPDIVLIQEAETIGKIESLQNLRPHQRIRYGEDPNKGILVYANQDYRLEILDNHDTSINECLPIRVTGPIEFTLLAVWTNSEKGITGYVNEFQRVIDKYSDLIAQTPTILAGDLNSNAIFDSKPPKDRHAQAVNQLASLGLVSAYHEYYGEEQGKETQPTWFQNRKQKIKMTLDYCFVPKTWVPKLESVEVGDYELWTALSDHCPLIVNLR